MTPAERAAADAARGAFVTTAFAVRRRPLWDREELPDARCFTAPGRSLAVDDPTRLNQLTLCVKHLHVSATRAVLALPRFVASTRAFRRAAVAHAVDEYRRYFDAPWDPSGHRPEDAVPPPKSALYRHQASLVGLPPGVLQNGLAPEALRDVPSDVREKRLSVYRRAVAVGELLRDVAAPGVDAATIKGRLLVLSLAVANLEEAATPA
mmetsp:Transcript_9538/g.29592  ORF Transcript_9538/g.29592 Transcript_9538/m.29592 type:complete len:208 (-) Transcript_9538:105-728(-)